MGLFDTLKAKLKGAPCSSSMSVSGRFGVSGTVLLRVSRRRIERERAYRDSRSTALRSSVTGLHLTPPRPLVAGNKQAEGAVDTAKEKAEKAIDTAASKAGVDAVRMRLRPRCCVQATATQEF